MLANKLLLLFLLEFFTSVLDDGFHWSLSDSHSLQVSRTLLSILAVLNNIVVWMVFAHPPTAKSSSPFNNLLVTVRKASIMIGIIVTFMFHHFFQFPWKVEVLINLFAFLQFYSVVSRDRKSTILQVLFFVVVVDYYKV